MRERCGASRRFWSDAASPTASAEPLTRPESGQLVDLVQKTRSPELGPVVAYHTTRSLATFSYRTTTPTSDFRPLTSDLRVSPSLSFRRHAVLPRTGQTHIVSRIQLAPHIAGFPARNM